MVHPDPEHFFPFFSSVLSKRRIFAEQDLHNLDIRTDVNFFFFERDFKEWEKQNVLSHILELKICIVFYEIRIFNLSVSSPPGII